MTSPAQGKSKLVKKVISMTTIQIWSAFIGVMAFVLRILSPASSRVGIFLRDRKLSKEYLAELGAQRLKYDRGILFFCSSAGEYEQARPIICSMQARAPRAFFHICFFSDSGIKFARATGEEHSFCLAPVDTLSNWRQLFSVLRPEIVVVVRHELWPSFLAVSQQSSRLYLVNASSHASKNAQSRLSKALKSWMLKLFDGIFVVDQHDAQYLQEHFQLASTDINAAGDSKYDRALERASIHHPHDFYKCIRPLVGESCLLIMGSAWLPDVVICLDAFVSKRQDDHFNARLIIVPHVPTERTLIAMGAECRDRDLTFITYSQIEDHSPMVDVVLVDTMGMLAEIYACATWAWVGGAVHHQVHNVLEPAAHGIPITFGPHFDNSKEALELVKAGLCQPCCSSQELVRWWPSAASAGSLGASILDHIKPLAGAAGRISRAILS